jgi:hypothetical protein
MPRVNYFGATTGGKAKAKGRDTQICTGIHTFDA